MKHKILLMGFLSFYFFNYGQSLEKIFLKNPSFEGKPFQSQTPVGWYDCSFMGESGADTHPNKFWGVNRNAQHGKTYIGMVARLNGTYESIYQKLKRPLVANQQYKFSISLCTSPVYNSGMNIRTYLEKGILDFKRSDTTYSFTTPVLLRIIGGRKDCKMLQLLAESPLIDNYDWKKFVFTFTPIENYDHFYLQAFYKDDKTPCNGNILLDNASTIEPIVSK